MRSKWLAIILCLICLGPAYALDKKIGSSNTFKIRVTDTAGNGLSGLDIVTPYADFVIKVQCQGSVVTIDETGETITDEGAGYYRITTNDALTPANEDECYVWAEGEGNYAGLLDTGKEKFKAVGATVDPLGVGYTYCDITASTSQSAFQIGSCVDIKGAAVTLASGYYTGMPMYAYTNGGATCNVSGHGVMAESSTLNGSNLDVVASNNPTGSLWPATPSAINCGIKIGGQ